MLDTRRFAPFLVALTLCVGACAHRTATTDRPTPHTLAAIILDIAPRSPRGERPHGLFLRLAEPASPEALARTWNAIDTVQTFRSEREGRALHRSLHSTGDPPIPWYRASWRDGKWTFTLANLSPSTALADRDHDSPLGPADAAFARGQPTLFVLPPPLESQGFVWAIPTPKARAILGDLPLDRAATFSSSWTELEALALPGNDFDLRIHRNGKWTTFPWHERRTLIRVAP